MRTIMVLTDFSDRAQHAAEFAWRLAIDVNASLLFYNAYYEPQGLAIESAVLPGIYGDYSIYGEEVMEKLTLQTERLKQKFQYLENSPIVSCKSDLGEVGDSVANVLREDDIWLIVMGDKSNNGFFNHLIFGSNSNEIVERATCPVLMIPEKVDYHPLKKISFASFAFNQTDLKALRFVIELVNPYNAAITVTHVSPKSSTDAEMEKHRQHFNDLRSTINYSNVTYVDITEDNITKTLTKFAESGGFDMITLVHKKHPFYEKLYHKSNTLEMMNYHKLPLLIFPAGL